MAVVVIRMVMFETIEPSTLMWFCGYQTFKEDPWSLLEVLVMNKNRSFCEGSLYEDSDVLKLVWIVAIS